MTSEIGPLAAEVLALASSKDPSRLCRRSHALPAYRTDVLAKHRRRGRILPRRFRLLRQALPECCVASTKRCSSTHTAVSRTVVEAMENGASQASGADLAVAITEVAGLIATRTTIRSLARSHICVSSSVLGKRSHAALELDFQERRFD